MSVLLCCFKLTSACALQWADVTLVDETSAEFDKLKQVRRQNTKPVLLTVGSHTVMVQQKLGQGAFASVYQVTMHSYHPVSGGSRPVQIPLPKIALAPIL